MSVLIFTYNYFLVCFFTTIFLGGTTNSRSPTVSTKAKTSDCVLLSIRSAFNVLNSQLNSLTSLLILEILRTVFSALCLLAMYTIPKNAKNSKNGILLNTVIDDTFPPDNNFLRNSSVAEAFSS